MKVIKIGVDGKVTAIPVEANGEPLYRIMSDVVGGYYENVPMNPLRHIVFEDLLMLCNEEGRILGLPVNPRASFMCGQEIRGDVLLCKDGEFEGEPDAVAFSDFVGDILVSFFDNAFPRAEYVMKEADANV